MPPLSEWAGDPLSDREFSATNDALTGIRSLRDPFSMTAMDDANLDDLLRQALVQRLAATGNNQALAHWADRHLGKADRANARAHAFAVARSVVSGDAVRVIQGLEEIVDTIEPSTTTPPGAEKAFAFFSPGKTCIDEVIRQFDIARQSCDVCVFTVTDDRITNAVIRAHARGVAVRV